MSFRVGFLRGAFVVLAAIALSGCPGDDEKVEVTVADAVVGDPATDGSVTVTAEVTVKGGEKDAEVTASMACGDSADAVGEATAGKLDKDDGKATVEVMVTAAQIGDDGLTGCKIKATAGDKSGTSKAFAIAAGEPAVEHTHMLSIEVKGAGDNPVEGEELTITVGLDKKDGTAESSPIFEGLQVMWTCMDADGGFTYEEESEVDVNSGIYTHTHPLDTAGGGTENNDPSKCQVKAVVTGAKVGGDDVVLKAKEVTKDVELTDVQS